MDIRSLTIDGQRLRIGVRAGAPRLPPLIVFNGIGASLELIEPFVSALPEREVVAFDVPGSGGSPASLLPYRFPGLARLAQRLLIELGYNGAVDALGVSWGGALAQTFAFHFPTQCRKLVLASTSPGALMVPGRPSVLAKLVSPRRYVDPDFLHAFGGEIYGGAFRSDPDLLRRHAQALWAPSNRGYLYQLIAAAGWTSLPSLAAAAAASPRLSCTARTIRLCRSSTPGSCPRSFGAPSCTWSTTATCSWCRRRKTSRRSFTAFWPRNNRFTAHARSRE